MSDRFQQRKARDPTGWGTYVMASGVLPEADMSNTLKLRTSEMQSPADAGEVDIKANSQRAKPVLVRQGIEVQKYGNVIPLPIGLDERICGRGVALLNQILADTMSLRDLCKKHHWQVSGPTFYQLHLLFDKHYAEQAELVDQLAERIQVLGGISMPWRRTWPNRPASRGRQRGERKSLRRFPVC